MTIAELQALGVSTDVPTACRALGIGASTGYAMAARNRFPVPVLRVGKRLIVPTRGLLEALAVGPAVQEATA